jgi:hypothetical protein
LGLDPSNGYDRKVMRGYSGSARVRAAGIARTVRSDE